jgi:hypothetical protein
MSASLDLALHPIAQGLLQKPFATSHLARDFLEAFRRSVPDREAFVRAARSSGPQKFLRLGCFSFQTRRLE